MSKKRFSEKKLRQRREVLVARYEDCRKLIQSDVRTIMEQGSFTKPCTSDDFEDPGTELTASIATRRRSSCHLLLEAIHRIDAGSYGLCEDCANDIPDRRLELNPEVTTCILCQEARECFSSEPANPVESIHRNLKEATAS